MTDVPDTVLLVGDSYSDQDLYYTTHFLAGDPFVYMRAGGKSTLVTSTMERGRAEKESSVDRVRTFEDYGYRDLLQETNDRERAFSETVARIAQEGGAEVVRVSPTFPVLHADTLRAHGVELTIDGSLFRMERRRKSLQELAAMEEAQRATEQVTAHAIHLLTRAEERDGILVLDGEPLTSERLRAEIEVFLVRQGMDTAHAPIVAGGPGAADPHWLGAGPLRVGEAIVLDIFPRSKRTRYFADMTRTVVRGEPDPRLEEMYAATLAAQEAAFTHIRAGASGRAIHAAVEESYRQAGFGGDGPGPRFIHGTGHGLGLDIHEAPGLGTADVELVEGDVVTVEPGLYDPEIGAVRIEDVVVVAADGYRNLTDFPKRFRI